MMKAFYDSLETLQKVQFATKKDYINLSIGVLVAIVIFGAFFIGVDTVWSKLYKTLYTTMRGDVSLEHTMIPSSESTESLLDTVNIEAVTTPSEEAPQQPSEGETTTSS